MLLTMSLTGGVLILLAALIRRFALGKMPKGILLLLWGVALARLLIPFPALYPVTVPLPEALTASRGIVRIRPNPGPDLTPPPAEQRETASQPLRVSGEGGETVAPAKAAPSPLALLWLGGAGVTALVFAGLYLFGLRRFRAARPLADGAAADWLRRHPLRRRLRLAGLPGLSSPMTHGLLMPVILLPEGFDPDSPEAVFVLEHEYVHVRRLDSLWKLLLTLALVVHWFNPAVWLLWFLAGRDLELSCDEAVLRRLGPDRRRDYARALVALEERRSRLAGLGFGYGCAAERIRAIMGFRRPGRLRRILSGLLVLILAAGALGGVRAGAGLSGRRVYRNGGVTLTVPADLAELILVQAPELPAQQQDPVGDVVFRVLEKESWEEGQARHPGTEGMEGFLFAILRTPEERAADLNTTAAVSRYPLARRGRDTFYTMLVPSTNTLAFGPGGADTRSERWNRWVRVSRWARSIREDLVRDNPDLLVYRSDMNRLTRRLNGALYGENAGEYTLRLGENGRAYPLTAGDGAEELLWDLVWETGNERTVYCYLPPEEPLILTIPGDPYELLFWEKADLMHSRRAGSAILEWDSFLVSEFLDGRQARVGELIRALYDAAKAAG